jgi:glutamate transport system permease protein
MRASAASLRFPLPEGAALARNFPKRSRDRDAMNVLLQYLPQFESGMLTTIALTLLGFVGALTAGILVAILRVSPVPILRGVGTVYVETLQNIPLLALLVISIFARPEVGLQADLFTTAALTIAVYEAAFIAEAIRAGINTVALGQSEAARALGLTFGQSLRFVIMPQALRAVIQPIGTLFIALTMNTALAAGVGIVELTAAANQVDLVEAQPIPIYVGAALGYMAIAAVGAFVTGTLERRMAIVR